uniref:Uncharacterized protein n=1 Tax=Musa acuminata subsp. malaccensis TaxID=214687 RepID=A0A804KR27_MUSAM
MMNSSLLALSHLKHLDLSFNNFSGIRIPEFIGSFKKLRYLNLSSTRFMGGIPARLGNLSSLYVLDLRAALDFTSHVDNLHWLSHLTSLKHLDLSWLNLTDLPDWFSSVNMLHSLQVLSMSSVGLDTIPASVVHVNFTSSLTVLDLSLNNFDSTLPKWLGNITSLTHLDLYNSGFYGVIPDAIGYLGSLTFLDLEGNQLEGIVPKSMVDLRRLKELRMPGNQLTGNLSDLLEQMTNLIILDLSYNLFNGSMPSSVGVIPRQLARFKMLQILDLANNNLSGLIPHNIGNLSAMRSTSQYSDFCYDELDVFTKGQDLHYLQCSISLMKSLDLSNNRLIGEIPKGIGELTGLKNLNLLRNHLQGKIPWEIGGMKSLESLDLSINDLSGNIPESLSALYSLSYLNLSYNNLSGMIPSGHQLQTFIDPSIYMGNANLCGPPIFKSCFNNKTTQNIIQEYKKEIPEWLWFYISMVLEVPELERVKPN